MRRSLMASALMASAFDSSSVVESWTMSDATMHNSPPPFGNRSRIKADQRKAAKLRARKRAKRLRHF